jgi:hypothetical protein
MFVLMCRPRKVDTFVVNVPLEVGLVRFQLKPSFRFHVQRTVHPPLIPIYHETEVEIMTISIVTKSVDRTPQEINAYDVVEIIDPSFNLVQFHICTTNMEQVFNLPAVSGRPQSDNTGQRMTIFKTIAIANSFQPDLGTVPSIAVRIMHL